ncbi:glycosyltransferase family 4 protein [Halovenus salina]|uniref:glycosyltransferase family 4 protein n=1 Tax=Halovenus salina TaxID=1510225 RepID=UPI002260CFB2|nr:glycosyltransferase family 4 protein [Halovenus salina]
MVKVLFFVNELTSTSIPVEISAKVHSQDDVEVTLVSYYDGSNDEIDPDVAELDIPMVKLAADSRLDFAAYRRLRQICVEQNIDILHTHHNSTGSLGRLAVIGTNTKVINTEHNDHRFFTHLQKSVNAISYPVVNTMVSNSENTSRSFEWYERLLLGNTRQEVVYNGIDAKRIDNARSPTFDIPTGPLVVTAGRLVEQKNYETLLRIFKTVVDRVPEATLVIVGDGPLLNDLQALARRLDIQDDVLFTGYLPRREDVYGVLKQAEIAVFPSWYEGFCVAAVEAMAAGLPVVVSDIAVLREVVGEPGLFADPETPQTFAEQIIELLENQEKCNQLGSEAKERARTTFSLERTAREYLNIYKTMAETP